MTTYSVKSTADKSLLDAGSYPATLSRTEYDELRQAINVIDALWYLEESYDVLLQNAIELETTVAHLTANQRANISSSPDEVDLEVRLLNRKLTNFLASARAFVDSIKARFSQAGKPLSDKISSLEAFFSEQFDTEFSYRLMEALRNHTQHRAAAIRQYLTAADTWHSAQGKAVPVLSVSPQIEQAALINNKKLRSKTLKEVTEICGPMIDLMPHLNTYVQCFGKIVDKARALYQPEYDVAVGTHATLLKSHLVDEWGTVWVTPIEDPDRRETLFTGAHELRRLERIRLRNVARDPEPWTR